MTYFVNLSIGELQEIGYKCIGKTLYKCNKNNNGYIAIYTSNMSIHLNGYCQSLLEEIKKYIIDSKGRTIKL